MNEYFEMLKQKYNLIIEDRSTMNNLNFYCSMDQRFYRGITIMYHGVKSKEGFKINLPASNIYAGEVDWFMKMMNEVADIVNTLNEYLEVHPCNHKAKR